MYKTQQNDELNINQTKSSEKFEIKLEPVVGAKSIEVKQSRNVGNSQTLKPRFSNLDAA